VEVSPWEQLAPGLSQSSSWQGRNSPREPCLSSIYPLLCFKNSNKSIPARSLIYPTGGAHENLPVEGSNTLFDPQDTRLETILGCRSGTNTRRENIGCDQTDILASVTLCMHMHILVKYDMGEGENSCITAQLQGFNKRRADEVAEIALNRVIRHTGAWSCDPRYRTGRSRERPAGKVMRVLSAQVLDQSIRRRNSKGCKPGHVIARRRKPQ
jgi:hypothetical protein